jgi:hypothetical protein
MMEAVNTFETSVNSTRLHDATSQKTVILPVFSVSWTRKRVNQRRKIDETA